MIPGDVVRCIDARHSQGRLKSGKIYVVRAVQNPDIPKVERNPEVPYGYGIKVWGADNSPGDYPWQSVWWKCSRFVPVNRKDLEIDVLAKLVDKIIMGAK